MNKRVEAITAFVVGLAEVRKAIKADAKLLVEKIPVNALLEADALAEYLAEIAETLTRKHLINSDGRIIASTAKLIRAYVDKMAVIDDD